MCSFLQLAIRISVHQPSTVVLWQVNNISLFFSLSLSPHEFERVLKGRVRTSRKLHFSVTKSKKTSKLGKSLGKSTYPDPGWSGSEKRTIAAARFGLPGADRYPGGLTLALPQAWCLDDLLHQFLEGTRHAVTRFGARLDKKH